jgi:uncharacterized membrane protein
MFAERAESRNKEFRFRGKEPGRLENFSDACFALAITLLLISTSPPSSFDQIRRFTWELIPFTVCIVFIILIWYEHFVFYYRYGIREGRVIVWNSLFLVIVLFYVYPLKFLFTRLTLIPIARMFDVDILKRDQTLILWDGESAGQLMIIYGLGAAAVFLVAMFMYKLALGKKEQLQLNDLEVFDTKASIRSNFLMALVPLISVLLAIIFYSNPLLAGIIPGFTYFLYTPVMWINGSITEKRRNRLLQESEAKVYPPENHFSSSNAGEPI